VQPIRNFSEANAALAPFAPQAGSLGRNYTLDRMRRLMDALGNPQDKYKVVHVAGTSGKTSTSYFMAALLGGAGQKVGLTVSPHIDEVNERVQINLVPLEETVNF
jgi:dihydrofolate synthase/folylpolyglutamate synthase